MKKKIIKLDLGYDSYDDIPFTWIRLQLYLNFIITEYVRDMGCIYKIKAVGQHDELSTSCRFINFNLIKFTAGRYKDHAIYISPKAFLKREMNILGEVEKSPEQHQAWACYQDEVSPSVDDMEALYKNKCKFLLLREWIWELDKNILKKTRQDVKLTRNMKERYEILSDFIFIEKDIEIIFDIKKESDKRSSDDILLDSFRNRNISKY